MSNKRTIHKICNQGRLERDQIMMTKGGQRGDGEGEGKGLGVKYLIKTYITFDLRYVYLTLKGNCKCSPIKI